VVGGEEVDGAALSSNFILVLAIPEYVVFLKLFVARRDYYFFEVLQRKLVYVFAAGVRRAFKVVIVQRLC